MFWVCHANFEQKPLCHGTAHAVCAVCHSGYGPRRLILLRYFDW